jgi:chloride channel protein, CIC family
MTTSSSPAPQNRRRRGWSLRARFNLLRLQLLRFEFRVAPTEQQRLFILTLLIGVVCGLAAVAFHLVITFLEHHLIARAIEDKSGYWVVWTIVSPTLGGLVAGLLLQYVFPNARGSGIPQVKVAFAARDGSVRLRDALAKFGLSALQIGSGASLGREGPTVQICAGIASAMGRAARVSPQSRRRLIPVGAAAGIAAAFNAPIAAVTFTIEEVVGKLDQTVLSGVIVAAALAAVIERSILGEHPVLCVPHDYGLVDARSLILYAALGVAAAAVSVSFTDSLLHVRAWYRKQRWIPTWARPASGGAVTGVLAVVMMISLRTSGVTGGGYEVLKQALSDHLSVQIMLALCVVKLVATVTSYSSGGAGGIFAPSLFIGAMLGGAFGSLDRTLFHHSDDTMGAFALVGMGAVFSATIRAPMTSVLIIVEMTSGYGLILPLMIANMSAYAIARQWRHEPIYEALLAQDGVHLRPHGVLDTLEDVKLSGLINTRPFATFAVGTSAKEMLRVSASHPTQLIFPVVEGQKTLVGMVDVQHIETLRSEPSLEQLVLAADIMRPGLTLKTEDDLRSALELMHQEGIREVPVLDTDDRLVGFIDEGAIARAYLRASIPNPN